MENKIRKIYYEPNAETLGERIGYVRTAVRRMSREEFAQKAFINRNYVEHIENNKHCPTALLLKGIAVALNVSADYLLGLKKWEDEKSCHLTTQF